MRYLTLSADYGGVSLRDELAGVVDAEELGLSADLVRDLGHWNEQYQPVIPTGVEERRAEPTTSLIADLDRVGLTLAERVGAEVSNGAKVKYYSEGVLGYLP